MPITSVYNFGVNPSKVQGSITVVTPDSNPPSRGGNSSETTNGASAYVATRELVGKVLARQPEQS